MYQCRAIPVRHPATYRRAEFRAKADLSFRATPEEQSMGSLTYTVRPLGEVSEIQRQP